MQAVSQGLFPKEGDLFAPLVEVKNDREDVDEAKANGGPAPNGAIDGTADTQSKKARVSQNKSLNNQVHTLNQQADSAKPQPHLSNQRPHNQSKSAPESRHGRTVTTQTEPAKFHRQRSLPISRRLKTSEKGVHITSNGSK